MMYTLCRIQHKIVLVDCGHLNFAVYNETLRRTRFEGYPLDSPIFREHLEKNFIHRIYELVSRYHIASNLIYLIRDDKLDHNWRKRFIYDNYKMARSSIIKTKKGEYNIGRIFNYIYAIIYPKLVMRFGLQIMGIPEAEADDVISIISHYASHVAPDIDLVIIARDSDYIQLLQLPNVIIETLSGYPMESKLRGLSPLEYLLWKILNGDNSDNIPACVNRNESNIFMRNLRALEIRLKVDKQFFMKFKQNQILIDFRYIPKTIRDKIVNKFIEISNSLVF